MLKIFLFVYLIIYVYYTLLYISLIAEDLKPPLSIKVKHWSADYSGYLFHFSILGLASTASVGNLRV